MADTLPSQLVHVRSVDEAVATLASTGPSSMAVAGATWVMRAPIRQETVDRLFVSLAGIDALKQIKSSDHELSLGALVTHDAIAKLNVDGHDLHCLKQAALKSANPAIRNAATIGGNICTSQFAAADLVPALLCLEAHIELQNSGGSELLSIGDYLSSRDGRPHDEILTRIIIRRSEKLSAHARLLMRQAGDYPVVNMSCSIGFADDGTVRDPRIAVGSVEASAKRWHALEEALTGSSLVGLDSKAIAATLVGAFKGRDGVDAPGWYRVKVLPKMVAQALDSIQAMKMEGVQ